MGRSVDWLPVVLRGVFAVCVPAKAKKLGLLGGGVGCRVEVRDVQEEECADELA